MEADVPCNEVLQAVCYCVSLPQMSQAARLPDDAEIGYNTGHEVFLAMDIRCCCDHLIPCGKGRAMRARSFDWMKARRADRTKRIYEQHDT